MIRLQQEAISFQASSPLGAALEELFAQIIKYRDELKNMSVRERVDAVVKFSNSLMTTAFPAIVKKHANLDVTKLVFSKKLNFEFAIMMIFGSVKSTINIIQGYSGLGWDKVPQKKPITAEELKKISQSLDLTSGKLTTTKINEHYLNCKIYFDPYSAFLVKECIHDRLEYFTAKEIAAIMLHENGHMLSSIEHAANQYYRIEREKVNLKYFAKYASKEERNKALHDLIFKYKNLLPDSYVKSLNSIVDSMGGEIDGTITKYSCSAILGMMFTILLYLIFSPVNLFLRFISGENDQVLTMIENCTQGKVKYGDVALTKRNFFFCERIADEYVSRNGFGEALSGALTKLHKCFEIAQFTGITVDSLRTSKALYYTCKALNLCTLALGYNQYGISRYEPERERLLRLMQNAIGVFKTQGASTEMIDDYLKEYESINNAINGFGKAKQALQSMWDFFNYIATIDGFMSMIASGRFPKEYTTLLEQTDRLMSNDLFYQAAKFDQLARRSET